MRKAICRHIVSFLLGVFIFLQLVFPVYSLGQAHLATSCIRNAKANQLNNIGIAIALDEILQKLGSQNISDYILVQCDAVDGMYANLPSPDLGIKIANYIVYSKAWTDLASQGNKMKLAFVVGHEIGHFELGHFHKKEMSIFDKEIQADAKGACAVARIGGKWKDVFETLWGIRSKKGGGFYPSFADSEKVARTAFDKCSTNNESELDVVLEPRSVIALFGETSNVRKNFSRAISSLASLAGNRADYNVSNLQVKEMLNVQGGKIEAPNLNQIKLDFEKNEALLMVFSNLSIDSEIAGFELPTFSGRANFVSTQDGGQLDQILIGLSEGFTEEANPRIDDLHITNYLAHIFSGYAALKLSYERGDSKETIQQYHDFLEDHISDLRARSSAVKNFDKWIKDLVIIDQLLEKVKVNIGS